MYLRIISLFSDWKVLLQLAWGVPWGHESYSGYQRHVLTHPTYSYVILPHEVTSMKLLCFYVQGQIYPCSKERRINRPNWFLYISYAWLFLLEKYPYFTDQDSQKKMYKVVFSVCSLQWWNTKAHSRSTIKSFKYFEIKIQISSISLLYHKF